MEQVIHNQQNLYGRLPIPLADDYAGYVARPDCNDIGEIVWLRRTDSNDDWEKFLVVDCAGRDAYSDGVLWMTERNVLVELDYQTALRWDTIGRGIEIDCLLCSEETRRIYHGIDISNFSSGNRDASFNYFITITNNSSLANDVGKPKKITETGMECHSYHCDISGSSDFVMRNRIDIPRMYRRGYLEYYSDYGIGFDR